MPEKILIVGGVALGPKAASRCKRLMPDAEVTLVDENVYISYGGCGIPYYVSGEVQNLDDLRATPYHTIRDPEFFRAMKGVTVRNQTRALSIDRAAKTLLVKDVISGKEEKLPYDKLVLATGASPRVPPVEGKDLKNVLSLTRLEAADAIRTACQEGKINEAVISNIAQQQRLMSRTIWLAGIFLIVLIAILWFVLWQHRRLQGSHEQLIRMSDLLREKHDELLKKNAATLKQGTIEIAKESERGIVDIETLQQTNKQLIETLDELNKIRADGKAKRANAEQELGRIEGELRQKMLEINS